MLQARYGLGKRERSDNHAAPKTAVAESEQQMLAMEGARVIRVIQEGKMQMQTGAGT